MVKIGDAIHEIINRNMIYSLLVSSGMANYTSLARRIQKKVEFITGGEVRINTIVKVLTGMKVTKSDEKIPDILGRSNIIAEYKYTEAHLKSPEEIGKDVMLAVKENDGYKCIIKSDRTNDLALIRILLPVDSSREPGITLLIVEYLNTFGLSIRNIYRLDTEVWITVNFADAGLILDRLGNFFYHQISDNEADNA